MRRIIAIADRATLPSLGIVAALNVLLFVGFLLVALAAAGHAEGGPNQLSAGIGTMAGS